MSFNVPLVLSFLICKMGMKVLLQPGDIRGCPPQAWYFPKSLPQFPLFNQWVDGQMDDQMKEEVDKPGLPMPLSRAVSDHTTTSHLKQGPRNS